jgi:hypothetical protein
MFKLLTIFCVSSILFISCNEDFDINGEWQDITVVYGLINQTDSIQYIKINKAFLGNGNANEMAKEADSIQYSQELDVKLIEYKLINNSYNPMITSSWSATGKVIELERTNEIKKSDTTFSGKTGTFGTQLNYLYKTTTSLTDGRKYKLQVIVPGKKDTITSEAKIIYNLTVNQPKTDVGTFKSYIDLSDSLKPYPTVWQLATYGKIYQFMLRFNYMEILNGDTTYHSFETYYPTLVALNMRLPSTQTPSTMSQKIGGPEFFQKVKSMIPVKANVRRKALTLDFYYFVAGANYYTYKNVTSSQTGYGQESSSYSNLVNAIGFFDARYSYSILGKEIKGTTHDELANGNYTKNLNFANGFGQWKK